MEEDKKKKNGTKSPEIYNQLIKLIMNLITCFLKK